MITLLKGDEVKFTGDFGCFLSRFITWGLPHGH